MALQSAVIDEDAQTITIVLGLEAPRPSASGKTMVIASSSGSVITKAKMDGHIVRVSANAYFKP